MELSFLLLSYETSTTVDINPKIWEWVHNDIDMQTFSWGMSRGGHHITKLAKLPNVLYVVIIYNSLLKWSYNVENCEEQNKNSICLHLFRTKGKNSESSMPDNQQCKC